jgi:hypothetical protein
VRSVRRSGLADLTRRRDRPERLRHLPDGPSAPTTGRSTPCPRSHTRCKQEPPGTEPRGPLRVRRRRWQGSGCGAICVTEHGRRPATPAGTILAARWSVEEYRDDRRAEVVARLPPQCRCTRQPDYGAGAPPSAGQITSAKPGDTFAVNLRSSPVSVSKSSCPAWSTTRRHAVRRHRADSASP